VGLEDNDAYDDFGEVAYERYDSASSSFCCYFCCTAKCLRFEIAPKSVAPRVPLTTYS